jgi:hypothetical protein
MTNAKDNLSIIFMINSILSSIPLPEDKKEEIKTNLFSDLSSHLGEDWSVLPVNSKRMAAVVFSLNYILLPYGITPSKVSEAVLKYSQEENLSSMANEVLEFLKPFTSSPDKFTSLIPDFSDLSPILKEKAQEIGSELTSKGKDLFGKLKDKMDKMSDSSKK